MSDQNWSAAISDATEALRLNPNITDTYEERGYAEMQLKDFAGAIKDYRLATQINPANANNFIMLGYLNEKLNNDEQAITDVRQALVLEPNNSTAKNNLNILLAKKASANVANQPTPSTNSQLSESEMDKKVSNLLINAANDLKYGYENLHKFYTAQMVGGRCGPVNEARNLLRSANSELNQAEQLDTSNKYSVEIKKIRASAARLRDAIQETTCG
ncbi:MAG TPA: hypothetical protein PKY82_12730 [Pyrinomonadaceae bacterium]|nr:hypothetical protein [Pyrinomonadaceae bacterium]